MAEPFLGEIKIVSFNFPPKGWALCNGQLLPINQNQALFSILGTTYGGDGQTHAADQTHAWALVTRAQDSHSTNSTAWKYRERNHPPCARRASTPVACPHE